MIFPLNSTFVGTYKVKVLLSDVTLYPLTNTYYFNITVLPAPPKKEVLNENTNQTNITIKDPKKKIKKVLLAFIENISMKGLVTVTFSKKL